MLFGFMRDFPLIFITMISLLAGYLFYIFWQTPASSVIDTFTKPVTPPNDSGQSVGFRGDGHKLGGGRVPAGFRGDISELERSPLGGVQGGLGQIKGLGDYMPGSWQDYVVESFAGPHDFLNHGYWYNSLGNAKNLTGFSAFFGNALNYANVFVASPIVLASVIQPYDYIIQVNRRMR